MIREVDLASYLPPFIAEIKEIRTALDAENPEFALVWKAADQTLKNEFIATADECGIARFEKILGILPENTDTLEIRRVRVQNRWFNVLPYTVRMLAEKLIMLLGDSHFFSIWLDIEGAYELKLFIYSTEDIRFDGICMKEVQHLLTDMVPMNIHYGINDGILIEMLAKNLAQTVLKRIRFKMGIPFWCEYVFDGSWLLDGSVILNNRKRYGLALGIGFTQGKFHTSERTQLFSVRYGKLKVKETEIFSAGSMLRFGIHYFGGLEESVLLHARRYGLSLDLSNKLLIESCTEDVRMRNLSARWEQHTKENIAANAGVHLEADPMTGHKQEKTALIVHSELEFADQEVAENVTVETKTRDYWFFDGKFLLDGTRKFNSFYEREEI